VIIALIILGVVLIVAGVAVALPEGRHGPQLAVLPVLGVVALAVAAVFAFTGGGSHQSKSSPQASLKPAATATLVRKTKAQPKPAATPSVTPAATPKPVSHKEDRAAARRKAAAAHRLAQLRQQVKHWLKRAKVWRKKAGWKPLKTVSLASLSAATLLRLKSHCRKAFRRAHHRVYLIDKARRQAAAQAVHYVPPPVSHDAVTVVRRRSPSPSTPAYSPPPVSTPRYVPPRAPVRAQTHRPARKKSETWCLGTSCPGGN
jgi:hypothetical protein